MNHHHDIDYREVDDGDIYNAIEHIDDGIQFINHVVFPRAVWLRNLPILSHINNRIANLAGDIEWIRNKSQYHNNKRIRQTVLRLEGRLLGIVRRVKELYRIRSNRMGIPIGDNIVRADLGDTDVIDAMIREQHRRFISDQHYLGPPDIVD